VIEIVVGIIRDGIGFVIIRIAIIGSGCEIIGIGI
jgi:hypothetical protein